MLDGGKRLLFASSFDGTWDDYIDDFATTGVAQNFEVTWNHVQGFPGIKDPTVKDWFKAHAVKASQFILRLSRADGEGDLESAGGGGGVRSSAG